MKAVLEFSLPEEREEHHNAVHGGAYRYALQNVDNWLRGEIKYGALDDAVCIAYEAVRAQIREELDGLEL